MGEEQQESLLLVLNTVIEFRESERRVKMFRSPPPDARLKSEKGREREIERAQGNSGSIGLSIQESTPNLNFGPELDCAER